MVSITFFEKYSSVLLRTVNLWGKLLVTFHKNESDTIFRNRLFRGTPDIRNAFWKIYFY